MSWNPLARLRLRHKFTLTLLFAALVPIVVASTVAVRLVLARLESDVVEKTDRTLRVALNLVLSNVQEVFEGAARLSEDPRLAGAVAGGSERVTALLEAQKEERLPAGLVEIADATGHVMARRSVGRTPPELRILDGAAPIARALRYERRVTLERLSSPSSPSSPASDVSPGGPRSTLVVRAAAPIVDEEFRLRGAVVLTVPLDEAFADLLKAELSADVIIYAGEDPIASSLVGPDGQREVGFAAPAEALSRVRKNDTAIVPVTDRLRSLSVGYAPLLDQEKRRIGMIAVASDEEDAMRARANAWRLLVWGGALAALLALGLAFLLSRALTRPLGRLHQVARAVARGNLDAAAIKRETGDEIGDLAEAFAGMTRAVRENQERLAARMREILTLHNIGRAVSSVLGLDDVLGRIVSQLTQVLAADKTALLFASPDGTVRIGAAAHLTDGAPIHELCRLLYWWDGPLLVPIVGEVPELAEAARAAGLSGSLLAVPMEQKDEVLGLLLVNREGSPFTDNDLRLVATFADHAATAIQNARLYEAVQRSSEELERKVEERTRELTATNQELGRALSDLGQAQAQLVLSERMAGLGFLVAGIAHEVNSPAGAIQGAIDALGENVERLVARSRDLGQMQMAEADRQQFFTFVAELTPKLAAARVTAPALVRRQARELSARFAELGLPATDAHCRAIAEIGAAAEAETLVPLALIYGLPPLAGYLEQYAYLHRNLHAIRTAIRRITRIIGALKGYSHLDQARAAPADIHEGIENTLIILHHELSRGILVRRDYAELPRIPVFVDELNQVWTNLLHNAVQAIESQGADGRDRGDIHGEILIETRLTEGAVEVAVQDSGPGIPGEIAARIFEPFFTTKDRGQGTGLGLGISRQIVEKHGGQIEVSSKEGCTRFVVKLPLSGPPRPAGEVTLGVA